MNKIFYPYYVRLKRIWMPILFVSLSFFIIFLVILPQISNITKLFQEIEDGKGRIQVLKDSLKIVVTSDLSELDSRADTVLSALPTVKDVARIFSALNLAAGSSGTTLREFSFNVGGIYGRAIEAEGVGPMAPMIDVSARAEGPDTESLVNFSKELSFIFPLSDVRKISESGGSASYQIGFFYKSADAAQLAKEDKVSGLLREDAELIEKLKQQSGQ